MGNCEICNKSVHERNLIFIDDKFICLQCDDNHEKDCYEEIVKFNHNKKFIDVLNEKINLLDNVENKYFHYLSGNFGVHVIFLKNRTLFFSICAANRRKIEEICQFGPIFVLFAMQMEQK